MKNTLFLFCFLVGGMFSLHSQSLFYLNGNIKSGALLVVKGNIKGVGGKINLNSDIKVSGSWTNDASDEFLLGTGNVVFNSTTAEQSVNGNSLTEFYNLTLNNSHAGIKLESNIIVSNLLQMQNGYIDLRDSNIDLLNSGTIIDESEINPIKVLNPTLNSGTVTIQSEISNTEAIYINPGNIGVGIKTANNLGNVTIIRGHQIHYGTGSNSENTSVARYFDIIPENSLSADLSFHFWDSELNGHLKSELIPYRFNIANYWEHLSEPTDVTGYNYIDFHTPGLSKFTLGSETTPLPVELLFFRAKCENFECSKVILSWVTASEINSDYFEIFRSSDNMLSWHSIGTLSAAGFSSHNIMYDYFDKNPPKDNTNIYYKLKQVDFDGKYDDSHIAVVQMSNFESKTEKISVFPNPINDEFKISIQSPIEDIIAIGIYDNLGKQLLYNKKEITVGLNEFILNITDFVPAMYHLKVISISGLNSKDIKLIKQ